MELPAALGGETFDRIKGANSPAQPWQWLALLFAGSGCAALIYEVVWLQMLQLVIGLTAVSLGLLLGTLMGGMGLGSLLLPRLVSYRRHPARVYACLELGIGAAGIALLFGMPWVERLYSAHGGAGVAGVVTRGFVAAVCLLPPAVLMGATLPALARGMEATPRGVCGIGLCYGANLAGAVGGCLLAGFYLLRIYDVATATYAAAGINLLVALLAFAWSVRWPDCATEPAPVQAKTSETRAPWLVYAVTALSGLTALGAEVVWTRIMSLMLGGTVYTFSIILAVFLAGIGLGSGVGSWWARASARPLAALGWCQLSLTVAVAWTAHMAAQSVPYWPVNPAISTSPWFNFQLDIARCLWVVLPAAFLWGASFPLALAVAATHNSDPGRFVGKVYTANTLGGIVGALGFSLLAVPGLGAQGAQRLLLALAGLSALLAWIPWGSGEPASPFAGRRLRVVGSFMGALAVAGWVIWLAVGVPALPWGLAAYGRYLATFGDRLVPGVVEERLVPLVAGGQDIFCTYTGEGLNGPIAVTVNTDGVRSFHAAGKVQASNLARDMRLQRLLGHISALGHKRPQSVLVVACGAGVTAGAFVLHPSIERIVICEIEPLVPQRVAPRFQAENYHVMGDPRVQVVYDDGRHFLRTTREKFDIITSDPIDPWVKGCAALNTAEYYQMCREHLNPGGVMTLWMPLYENDARTAKSMMATFFQVFTNGVLWSNDDHGEAYDAVLYGQAGPLKIDVGRWRERLAREDHAAVRRSLADAGFASVSALLATYAGQAPDLRDWLRGAAINTDRNLRLQYLAGMWLNTFEGTRTLAEITRHYRFPDPLFAGPDEQLQLLRKAIEKPRGLDSANSRQANVNPQSARHP
jgi:spermidine synthase